MIVCIIQARMGSTRLPGKVARSIAGRSMLARVIERAGRIPGVGEVVVATSEMDADRWVLDESHRCGVRALEGPIDDVLTRYEGVAGLLNLGPRDYIVRLTADCPLLDPVVSSRVIQLAVANHVDYASNLRDWPDGLDTEVFSMAILRDATYLAAQNGDREHVTPWMRRNGFCLELSQTPNLRFLKWSVDTEEDLEYVREVYQGLGDTFGWKDILGLTPGQVCPGCRAGVPHAQRARGSIGGPRDYTVWDLHETTIPGGAGIEECQAWAICRRRAETPNVTIGAPALGATAPRSRDGDLPCRSDGVGH